MHDATQRLDRYETYLAADPGNTELLAQVIDLSLASGDSGRAERHVRAALQRFPADPYFLARLASVHLAQGAWAAAAELLEGVLAQHADVHLAYNLAYAYAGLGRHADACARLAPYAEAEELTAAMATLVVRSLHHLGEGERAIAYAEAQIARLGPDRALLAAASLVCFDANQLTLAAQWATAALQAGAEAAQEAPLEALVTAGSLALAQTDAAAARAHFEQALARHPAEGRSWSGLGTASLLRGDLSAARQQLEKAVHYLPAHIGSWHLLGWSRLLAGQLTDAQAAFERALALDRNFGESHGGLAVVLARQGQREPAEAAIARALGLDADGLSARYAQMILAGQADDPARFRSVAMRLLAARQGAFGHNLAELVQRHVAR